jgi:hypothetical protein
MGSFLSLFLKVLPLIPTVIAGVEQLHGEKDGATKKQMAQDALSLATGVASAALPAQAQAVQVVSAATSSIIDATVSAFNAAGVFQTKSAPAA